MKIVIDTNIIFSATLSKNSKFRSILSNEDLEFFAPNSLIDEILNNQEKLFKYSNETPPNIVNFLIKIFAKIRFVNLELIPRETYNLAFQLCKDYDQEDTPFVALSLHIEAKYWTGDKIKNHLIKHGFDNFFDYKNLL